MYISVGLDSPVNIHLLCLKLLFSFVFHRAEAAGTNRFTPLLRQTDVLICRSLLMKSNI